MRSLSRFQKEVHYEGEGKTGWLTVLFCCFIGGLLVLFLAFPKADFSNEERRSLQEFPKVSARTIFGGDFEEDMETYFADHFPFRRFWVGLNSYVNLGTGRRLINDVYVGEDEYFIQAPVRDDENLGRNLAAVRWMADTSGTPTALLTVPSTGFIMEGELPPVHLPYEDPEIMELARQTLGQSVQWIDLVPTFESAARQEQVYYRTDHHWTTPGAYEAYVQTVQNLGMEPVPKERFTVSEYGGFLGTTYAKVLLWGVTPDTIQVWTAPGDFTIEMEDSGEAPKVTRSFYDTEALSGYDPYMVFFGGNHSAMHITNNDPEASGRLLVLKDSFANSLLPFLAPHYKELTVIDPRYYRGIPQLLEENTFDQVLFCYGINNLVTDQSLGMIDV